MVVVGMLVSLRRKRAAIAIQNRKRQANLDEDLLEDHELVRSTTVRSLGANALDPEARLRHDLCVLQLQQLATEALASPATESSGTSSPCWKSSEDTVSALVKSSIAFDKTSGTVTRQHDPIGRPRMSLLRRAARSCTETCRALVSSWVFEYGILLLILLGSLMMALDQPGLNPHGTLKRVIVTFEEVLLYVFSLEMILKMTALGLVNRQSYFKDDLNKLDALIVLAGWTSLAINQSAECEVFGMFFCIESSANSVGISALRSFRVLRPLQAVKKLNGMKVLLQALLRSIPDLRDSMVLCGFFMVLYSVAGIQLYMGALQQRCVAEDGSLALGDDGQPMLCSLVPEFGKSCPSGSVCKETAGENMNSGFTSFDNMPAALLTVFECITLEGWTDIMYSMREVRGSGHDFYFISLVFFGAIFMVNIVVAVLVANFMASSDDSDQRTHSRSFISMRSTTSHLAAADDSNPEERQGCLSCPRRLAAAVKRCCRYVSLSDWFRAVTFFLILVNTVVMAMDNIVNEDILETLNLALTVTYSLELFIKLVGLGPKQWRQDAFNIFDAVVVVVSWVDIILTFVVGFRAGPLLTVMRTLRLFRIAKISNHVKSLQKIIDALLNSLVTIANLWLLLLMYMFICALLGMNFFGVTEEQMEQTSAKWGLIDSGLYKGHMARPNFSNFLHSLISVFIVVTGENWNEVMYVAMESTGWVAALYFVPVMIVGNYIILNLFLAVLMDQFAKAEQHLALKQQQELEEEESAERRSRERKDAESSSQRRVEEPTQGLEPRAEEQEEQVQVQNEALDGSPPAGKGRVGPEEEPDDNNHNNNNKLDADGGELQKEKQWLRVLAHPELEEKSPNHRSEEKSSNIGSEEKSPYNGSQSEREGETPKSRNNGSNQSSGGEEETPRSRRSRTPKKKSRAARASAKLTSLYTSKQLVDTSGLQGYSLYIFSRKSWIRAACWDVIRHQYFDQLIFGLICVNSLVLVVGLSPDQDADEQSMFLAMDAMLTALFAAEALMKIIVYGFVIGPHSYLRNGWNVMDLVVVCISIWNLTFSAAVSGNVQLSWVKVVRSLKVLRMLKVVTSLEGMKVVVISLVTAMPAIMEVVLVLLLFLVTFSILGVQLLKNTFWLCSCQDFCPEKRFNPLGSLAAGKNATELCQGSCPGAPVGLSNCDWMPHPEWSFDNIGFALLALFEVAAMENWTLVLFAAMDGVSVDEGPQYNYNPWVAIFFILYVFVMAFFVFNLFVGVVINQYTIVMNHTNGSALLTDGQLRWLKTQKLLLNVRRHDFIRPTGRWRQLALQLVESRELETVIIAFILLHVCVLCTESYQSWPALKRFQESIGTVVLPIFTFEAVIKLFALSPRIYFHSYWNVFDFTVVVGSNVAWLIQAEFLATGKGLAEMVLLRFFRIVRIFRLIQFFSSLRNLVETLVSSLMSLVNVGALLLLLFFVYAVAGMALFGDIQIDGNPELKALSEHANFQSFYVAMVLLLRMSTGESWNRVMHDCFSGARCAAAPHKPECGDSAMAIAFFVSFMVLGSFVLLNLFVAVIVDSLFQIYIQTDDDADSILVTQADLDDFAQAWARLVPCDRSDWLPTNQVLELMQTVKPPLGFKGEVILGRHMLQVLHRLGIRDFPGSKVHFMEVLCRLSAMVAGSDMTDVMNYEVVRLVTSQVSHALPVPEIHNRLRLGLPCAQKRSATVRHPVIYLASQVLASVKLQSWWKALQVRRMFSSIVGPNGAKTPPLMSAIMGKREDSVFDEGCFEDTSDRKVVPAFRTRLNAHGDAVSSGGTSNHGDAGNSDRPTLDLAEQIGKCCI
ncbi:unnamed protein product [Polarella glacialis]|uniref:Calcium-channel protein CCH1 n=1 Tax=Polarella glacialis TaxID=89957 RepID=A0A813E4F0_POLGL|nr:unnamed protein product [Polarella glacialis]